MSSVDDNDNLLNNLPNVLPILPLTHPWVFYPFATEGFTCTLAEKEHIPTLMADIQSCGNCAVIVGTKPGVRSSDAKDIYTVGVVVSISEMEQTPEGKLHYLAQGLERVTIGTIIQDKPYTKAQISLHPPLPGLFDEETKRLYTEVLGSAKRLYAIIQNTTEDKVLTNFMPVLQSHDIYVASSFLAYLLQGLASIDWSVWKGKHTLQMDAALRLQLLTCDSDKERVSLLKNFLDTEVPLFEADNQKASQKTNQKAEHKEVTIPGTDNNHHDYDTSLGKDTKTGEDIWISQYARRSGMLILGSTGYGKSGLINQLVASDMRQVIRRKGGREEKIGICVIAPDGDLIDSIISRVPKEREEDVILLDPIELAKRNAYFGLNLFSCPNPSDPALLELTVEQVLSVFRKLLGVSFETPRLANFIQQITRSLIGTGFTLVDVPEILLDTNIRNTAIPTPTTFWRSYNLLKPADQFERIEPVLTRIADFADNQILRWIIGQSAMFPFQEAIDNEKIILVNIPGEYEHLGRLVGGIVIGQILLAMLKRKDVSRSQRGFFNLYIDEFQNYVSPTINKMATECRKYGLALTVAHQSTEQEGITDEIKATTRQVGSKIFFRLSNIDASEVADVFDTTPPPGDLIERPVRVPAQQVLKHLLEKGHENPEVNKLFNDYIRPIYDHPANNYTDGRYSFISAGTYEKWKNEELRYCIFGGVWEGVEKLLNRLLVQLMEGSIGLGSVAYEQALYQVVLALSRYFHFDLYYVNEPHWNTAGEFSLGQLSTIWVSSANIPQMEEMRREIFWLIVQAHHRPDCPILMQEPIAKRTAVWEQIVNDPQKAKENAERECKEVMYFAGGVGLLGHLLSKSPILVDSGKYEKVEGPRQSYQDRENEIANTLTHLPARHAMISIPSGEYTMKTHDISSVADITNKKDRILENTIRQYCKSRSLVEQEIAERIRPDELPTQRKHTLS